MLISLREINKIAGYRGLRASAFGLPWRAAEEELYNAQECIAKLQKALIAQIKLGEQLNSTLETVCEENAELKETIEQQQNKIDVLEPQMKRIAEQMRFFKQVALQHTQNKSIAQAPETFSVN